ncbi:MAG: YbjQ family protein [Dehalococcoidia bacterium]
MVVTTTNGVEGRQISEYLNVVAGETVLGVNMFKDITAAFRDIVGGRSGKYEEEIRKGRETSIQEMISRAQSIGADAVVGVKVDYETVGGQMLMVTACGTAVKLA